MRSRGKYDRSALFDGMRFSRAKTKREAVVTAIVDFNRRRRMADLIKYAGTCPDLMTVEELQAQRRRLPSATRTMGDAG